MSDECGNCKILGEAQRPGGRNGWRILPTLPTGVSIGDSGVRHW